MNIVLAIFVLATSIRAGDPDGDQEGAKMIAAMSKELNELKKQQKADRQQLHKEIADLKNENMEFRRTQAILRDAEVKFRDSEIKFREADNELRMADERIKVKETEKKRQSAPQRQKDNIAVAAKELALSEIKRYHASSNYTSSLTKLIDSEIRRLTTTQSMTETVFVGGTPGASSEWSGYPKADAFKLNPAGGDGGWTSGNAKTVHEPPAYIWYDYKRQLRPAKISYLPRKTYVVNANLVRVKRFQFVGTDDTICSKNSDWKVLCEGESASYESIYDERGCTVPVKQNMGAFHCLGLRSLAASESAGEVSLRGIRIWIYQ